LIGSSDKKDVLNSARASCQHDALFQMFLAPGVLGSQKTARGGISHHLVTINKNYIDLRHSIASFQMRHILRRQRIKAEQKDLTHQDAGMEEVLDMASSKKDSVPFFLLKMVKE
jgi:hypothetical protein